MFISLIGNKRYLVFIKLINIICFCFFATNLSCQNNIINPSGATVAERFLIPKGYTRLVSQNNSFAYFLQQLSLKPHGSLVHLYNGVEKQNKVAAAILSVDVGKKDLQQCADAVMRLRAEFLYKTKQYNKLHFKFTNGFNALYSKWREGYRIAVNGNKASWIKTNKESTSYNSFKDYLQIVFTYAGTASLAKELKLVNIKDMQIGDVLIKGGSPGHAVIVLDMAEDKKTNKKLFVIAQSYMPAQDIHILINNNNANLSPWYELNAQATSISTPEWDFYSSQLMRFE